jgi:GNAT superfamily N-acetyltransferase
MLGCSKKRPRKCGLFCLRYWLSLFVALGGPHCKDASALAFTDKGLGDMEKRGFSLRLGRPTDAPAVAVLVRRVLHRWVLPDQPRKAALALLERSGTRSLREKILEGQRFHLAYWDGVLVGISAMRDDSHLVQFFVSTRYQGRGIARQLWVRTMQDAVRRAGTRRFTLNATRCAVPIYKRLGFRATGPERPSPMGVISTPMVLVLPKGRGEGA